MRKREENYVDNSNYFGVFVIYLVSSAVAAILIFPGEEYWYFGVIKSLFWPLYCITKF